jgi:hypothetical protein
MSRIGLRQPYRRRHRVKKSGSAEGSAREQVKKRLSRLRVDRLARMAESAMTDRDGISYNTRGTLLRLIAF